MKYSYGAVAAFVKCEDCDWQTESYKNAQALAAKHAKKYGHRVRGDLTVSFTYDGSSIDSK